MTEEQKTVENSEVFLEENELLYITKLDGVTEFEEPTYIDLFEKEDGLLIEEGGEYVLSGKTNKTVKIDVHDEVVHLFLGGVTIETAIGPALEVVSGGKVIITLMDNTENVLSDAAYYSDENVSGAISSVCDLTINGTGSLNVCGYYKDAVYSKDVFKMLGGTVQLKAKRNGIKGNDGILLIPERLVIESEKNGCQTSNADKEDKGVIAIQGGEISIVAGQYGLSSVSDVYVREGIVYSNSVVADIYAEGKQHIAEGIIVNE